MDSLFIDDPLEHLKKSFENKDENIIYLSPNKIYKFYNGRVAYRDIKDVLETSESYTLLRQEIPRSEFNHTLAYHARDIIQADIFYIDKLSNENNGYKYVLTVIDCYTKYAFVEALIHKNANDVNMALLRIFHRMGSLPKILSTDRGTEFTNSKVKASCRRLGIRQFFAMGDTKVKHCNITRRV